MKRTFHSNLQLFSCRSQHRIRRLRSRQPHERLVAHQTHAHLLQAPSAAHHEVILCNQSQSRREGSEAIVTENGFTKESPTGEWTYNRFTFETLNLSSCSLLQVWFQNARAKWRRMMMKQDGSGMLEKGDGTLDLDSISVHSPTSFMLGGANSTPPHNLD